MVFSEEDYSTIEKDDKKENTTLLKSQAINEISNIMKGNQTKRLQINLKDLYWI